MTNNKEQKKEEHTCEEDHDGFCYFCYRNMLVSTPPKALREEEFELAIKNFPIDELTRNSILWIHKQSLKQDRERIKEKVESKMKENQKYIYAYHYDESSQEKYKFANRELKEILDEEQL